ncbi:MAG: hypothetical protein ACI3Y5_04405 [Prevotella sp.]
MKKLTLVVIALAAMVLASCGNKTNADASGQDSDSIAKSFDQQQIEASVKMHLDSIAAEISTKKFTPLYQAISNSEIKLTADEKKVKPTYLLDPATTNDLQTILQKYAAFALLQTDQAVAALYEMDTTDYETAIAKLLADINDPALEKLKGNGSFQQIEKEIYEAEEKSGRIHFFWTATCAATIEQLYVASMNADKFLEGYNDEDVANITFRIVLILDAIDRLSVYDAEVQGLADAIQPLKKINATTVDELKKELGEIKDELAGARKKMLG